MPEMLQELIANEVFSAQETYGAAWVWGSPWDGQGHSKQFCHFHWGQYSGSLLQSTIMAVIRTYLDAFSVGTPSQFPSQAAPWITPYGSWRFASAQAPAPEMLPRRSSAAQYCL